MQISVMEFVLCYINIFIGVKAFMPSAIIIRVLTQVKSYKYELLYYSVWMEKRLRSLTEF